MCELMRIDRSSFSSINFRSISNNSSLAMTSSPKVGSSKINNLASWEIAISTFSLAFIPVEKSLIFLSVGNWNLRAWSMKKELSKLLYRLFIIGIRSFIVKYPPNPESERTTPRLSLSSAVNSRRSFPRILIFPPSAEINPKTALNVVLFPAPFCPIKPVI